MRKEGQNFHDSRKGCVKAPSLKDVNLGKSFSPAIKFVIKNRFVENVSEKDRFKVLRKVPFISLNDEDCRCQRFRGRGLRADSVSTDGKCRRNGNVEIQRRRR